MWKNMLRDLREQNTINDDDWGEPERAPHKPVVTVRCTSVACPKFYGDDTESPTLVIAAYVYKRQACPKIYSTSHMLRNTWSIWRPMLPL